MSRQQAIRRVALVVFTANLALTIAKAAVWQESGSLAVGSEAVNSLADTAYSLIILGGVYLTTQPPDREHPHGHERIEPFVSLFVAIGIFGAGAVVVWQAASTVLTPASPPAIGPAAFAVLGGSAALKFGLYRYVLAIGQDRHSPALVATAMDNRNDIFTAVAALVGVVGVRAGFPLLDPLAAAVVSIGIFYTGWEVVRANVNYLIGRAPPPALRQTIVRRALEHPEVDGVHDVIAHYVGPEVDVSLHVEVQGDRTLLEAHDIESEVVEAIGVLPEVDDVFVHVDPRELGEWKRDRSVDHLIEDRGNE